MDDQLVIAGRSFASRLFLGTGKFPSNESLRATIEACGTGRWPGHALVPKQASAASVSGHTPKCFVPGTLSLCQ